MKEEVWKGKLKILVKEFLENEGKGVEEIYLFGSRVWGGAGYASDFDLAVKGEGGW